MRKPCIFFVTLVVMSFLFSTLIGAQECLKLLKIVEPAKGKNKLNLNLEHIKTIVESFKAEGAAAEA